MGRYAIPDQLSNMFLIEGGALAVENALKTAFDWKVQKNFAKGHKDVVGSKVIHFREAFHGRSGYTMSLTNTDPAKVKWFPKFDWPRITTPKITFPLEDHLNDVVALEEKAKQEIKAVIQANGDDIAALIIEPIQGEGGDNHFRPEFFQFLREVTAENEIIFILDEIQTGVGVTGKFWAYQHTDITPDIISFGKKLQVCGILASERINQVDSVFKVPSRINSTWGGNLTDMVRATRYLQIIAEDNLVENARVVGDYLLGRFRELGQKYDGFVTNARGKGLMCAFDLPDGDTRGQFLSNAKQFGMIALGCGKRTVRLRPPLNLTREEVDEGVDIADRSLKAIRG
jgi:L-lysine 6-transaminase